VTDRIHSLTVVLAKDVRDDDVQGLISAIMHLKNVAKVKTHVSDPVSLMAETRARMDLRMKIVDEVFGKEDRHDAKVPR
jgi:hypothetical protein